MQSRASTVAARAKQENTCVRTGNGEYVSVGSNKEAPYVSSNNPNSLPNGQLDLQPGSGDQYGARYAADQGQSRVERPSGQCTP